MSLSSVATASIQVMECRFQLHVSFATKIIDAIVENRLFILNCR
jgi:hypothetical protein